MTCYTFGSPPVLAHAEGGSGPPVMGLLGLPPSALRNFALENDPVPRALLSVDPTYQVGQLFTLTFLIAAAVVRIWCITCCWKCCGMLAHQ